MSSSHSPRLRPRPAGPGAPPRPVLVLAIPFLLTLAWSPAAGQVPPDTVGEPRLAELAPRYREWLDGVSLLLADEERQAFLALRRDYQRESFIRRFWEVRDPFPNTSRNELQERWETRLTLARQRYDGLEDARARLLLLHGEPAAALEARCGGLLRPLAAWYYERSDYSAHPFVAVVVSRGVTRAGPYRLWSPSEGIESLRLIGGGIASTPQDLLPQISSQCFRGEELLGMLANAAAPEAIEERLLAALRPDLEWVLAFQARSTDLPEAAATLPCALEVRFPRRHQSRTVLQGLLRVPAEAARAEPGPQGPVYRFVVDGEILRKGELFDSFRYRFDVPAGPTAESVIPLVLERFLRPGYYDLILKVEELHAARYFRHEGQLEVPLLSRPEELAPRLLAQTPWDPAATEGDEDEVAVRLAEVPGELVTGLLRVQAEVRGEAVARVRFELDDAPVLSKRNPPFSVELDLGRAPRVHVVRAVAEDDRGRPLAADELTVNAGPSRFAVRLVEPHPTQRGRGELRAYAVVEVPTGERLDRVELYLDETLLATLYQRPFVQPLQVPEGREVSYVRAVAYLAEGGSAEDLRFLNAPENLDSVDVQLVELYTTVVDRKGRPVLDLTQADFRILEDDREQTVRRFEWIDDLPVHTAVLLDTSTSMQPVIDAAEKAALGFFEQLLTDRDRASVITFNDQPQMKVRFTNRLDVLAGGLAGIAVEGETALYDSLIYALYHFGGIRGKRMLVLISDGEDVSSRYSFEEVLEFARRTGVAIYCIGIKLSAQAELARMALRRFATETGGRAFFIDDVTRLSWVYRNIERELRSQYLLAYQSDQGAADPDRYRVVEVELARPGLSARTLRGYYP